MRYTKHSKNILYNITYSIKQSFPDDKILFKKMCNMPHLFVSIKSLSEFLANKCERFLVCGIFNMRY